ncbi:Endosomal sorting complex protein [Scedosporium apiospermum]|uniref:Endosomal sorting complex protein n=1 Tax=Pseudallescheria apiosperma TaxID=563466 RepID=A0A084FZY5_PSEDA|nr:Endosomal sorting complex protein [Scedosporium apiospermum]KEZ40647.1 Endosomal sorting complex protein [Scedosporium apiospermum]
MTKPSNRNLMPGASSEDLEDSYQEYHDVNRTYNDVAQALSLYPSLSPRTDVHTFDNGVSALLVHLSGTLPVVFRGATYRFPVSLWVPHAYPKAAPLVYVKPTETMLVRPGQYVDPQGQVYHPYLAAWANFWDKSTLADLLTILTDIFAKEPPVIARQPQPPQAARRASPSTAQSPQPGPASPPFPRPPSIQQIQPLGGSSQAPPPPPKPGAQPVSTPTPPPPLKPEPLPKIPPKPTSPPEPSSSRASDQPPHPPPPPPRPHSTYNQTTQVPVSTLPAEPSRESRFSRYESAPPLPQQAAPAPHPPGLPAHSAAPPHFVQTPQHPPQWPSSTSQPLPQAFPAYQHGIYPGGPPQQPVPQQQVPILGTPQQLQAPKRPPPPDLLDEPLDMKEPEPSNVPPPPIPPNPERDALLRQLGKALYQEREKSRQRNDAYIAGLEAQRAAMINAYNTLSSERQSLSQVSALLNSNATILREALRKADAVIESSRQHPQPDIDELLVAPTVVANQLYTLVAEERAIGDAIFMLGRAVEHGRITPAVFAKTTRSLAREWYLKKALVRKIATGMGLSV